MTFSQHFVDLLLDHKPEVLQESRSLAHSQLLGTLTGVLDELRFESRSEFK
jgi:hypothetical protein